MYKFVKDKDFLHSMRSVCSDIVNQLVQIINNQDFLTVKAHLIGSGAKNLITQNENEPIDLDYNLVVINSEWDIYDCKKIKEYIKEKFNYVLENNDEHDCNDSKSCLSTKKCILKETIQLNLVLILLLFVKIKMELGID